MAENYLIYPTKTINVTQTYAQGNHASNSGGYPADYPTDDGCDDAGRSWFYCPCDQIKIVRIYGVGSTGINTVWMTSTSKVVMPCGVDYVTIMVEHPEDDDLKKLHVGQTFLRGAAMFREGGNGAKGIGTYGNHFHISAGTGQIKGNGWVENSKGAWVLSVTGATKKATDVFYLDGQKIRNTKTYSFKTKPAPKPTSAPTPQKDNIPDKYAKSAIEWAVKNKILQGSDGDYKLHSSVTREDVIVFLERYAELRK